MESRFKANFTKLLFGNVGAQVISLSFYPVLTRLYTPVEFGIFGVFNSIVQIAAIYSTGQFHTGMLSHKDPEERKNLFTLALVLNVFASIFFFICSVGLYFSDLVPAYYLFVPLGVLCYGSMEIQKVWAVTEDALGVKSVLINLNRLSSNVLKLFGKTSLVLIVSEIGANLLTAIGFFRYSKKDLVPLKHWKQLVFKHRNYPIFFTFYLLSQILSSEAVTIYLQQHLTASEVGIFFLGNKLFVQTALVFSSMLSYSFSYMLTGDAANRLKIYKKSLIFYVVGISCAAILALPNYTFLVRTAFGVKWIGLSEVLNFFLILAPVKILVGFFAYIVLLAGHTKFISIFKFVQFLLLLLALQFGFSSLKGFLMIFVPFEVIFDTIFIAWGYWLVRKANA